MLKHNISSFVNPPSLLFLYVAHFRKHQKSEETSHLFRSLLRRDILVKETGKRLSAVCSAEQKGDKR